MKNVIDVINDSPAGITEYSINDFKKLDCTHLFIVHVIARIYVLVKLFTGCNFRVHGVHVYFQRRREKYIEESKIVGGTEAHIYTH